MPNLVIVAHAPLATALQAVATHLFADRAHALAVVDVQPQWSVEQAEQAVRDAVSQVRLGGADHGPQSQVLILADAFGATPCNAAQRVADGAVIRLVAGVNVPMLWRTLAHAEMSVDALAERALAGGVQGVMPASPQRSQDQTLNSPSNDPSNRHHQQ